MQTSTVCFHGTLCFVSNVTRCGVRRINSVVLALNWRFRKRDHVSVWAEGERREFAGIESLIERLCAVHLDTSSRSLWADSESRRNQKRLPPTRCAVKSGKNEHGFPPLGGKGKSVATPIEGKVQFRQVSKKWDARTLFPTFFPKGKSPPLSIHPYPKRGSVTKWGRGASLNFP